MQKTPFFSSFLGSKFGSIPSGGGLAFLWPDTDILRPYINILCLDISILRLDIDILWLDINILRLDIDAKYDAKF